MKKLVLWEKEFGGNYLLEAKDIEEQVWTGEEFIVIEGIDIDKVNIEELNEKLKQYEEENEDFYSNDPYELKEFLENLGYENIEVKDSLLYEDVRNVLVFDKQYKNFGNLTDYDIVKTYNYWDGSNQITIELAEGDFETELIVTDDYVTLDEWNGSNWETGGTGLHQDVYKILEKNGRKVEDEYLIVYSSQWQGEQDKGQIVDLQDLEIHLEELGRDVDEYIQKIKTL